MRILVQLWQSFPDVFKVALISMIPLSKLKGGVAAGYICGLSVREMIFWPSLGSFVSALIYAFIVYQAVNNGCFIPAKRRRKYLEQIDRLRSKHVRRSELFGMVILVGILINPIPAVGGNFSAILFCYAYGINLWRGLGVILITTVVSAVVMTVLP